MEKILSHIFTNEVSRAIRKSISSSFIVTFSDSDFKKFPTFLISEIRIELGNEHTIPGRDLLMTKLISNISRPTTLTKQEYFWESQTIFLQVQHTAKFPSITSENSAESVDLDTEHFM